MSNLFRAMLAPLLLLSLPACSALGGGDREPVEELAVAPVVQPVDDVRAVEIGRTRDGIVVTAYGLAPGIGYADPRLEPRRGGRIAEDGFLDFDFVATAPDSRFGLPAGDPAARIVRADRLIGMSVLRQALGLRIHGASGGQSIAF